MKYKVLRSSFLFLSFLFLIIISLPNIVIDENKEKSISINLDGKTKEVKLGNRLKDVIDENEKNVLSINTISDNYRFHNNDVIDSNKSISNLININTSTINELTKLQGIGIKTAEKIIEYRNTFGPFNSIDEITNVSGIGIKKYEKIKEFISI